MPNVDRLTKADMFGTTAEIARVAGIHKSAVVRWRQKRHPVQPIYQERILTAAAQRKFNLQQVAKALGVPRCPTCGTYHVVHQ
jgi:hypothetical protein